MKCKTPNCSNMSVDIGDGRFCYACYFDRQKQSAHWLSNRHVIVGHRQNCSAATTEESSALSDADTRDVARPETATTTVVLSVTQAMMLITAIRSGVEYDA